MAASLSSWTRPSTRASVVVVDFYNRLVLGRDTGHDAKAVEERHQIVVSRVATFVFGALGTVLAVHVSRIGSLLEIANKLINAFTGPLFGIYLLAMFNRRATSGPTLAAGIIGNLTMLMFYYWSRLDEVIASRFALPLYFLLALLSARLVGDLDLRRLPGTRLAASGSPGAA
jgi:Na+/proline symporter